MSVPALLFPEPGSVFIKICGLTRLPDAEICASAGAGAIGINLYQGSSRYHPLSVAKNWLPAFHGPGYPARVALFVNAPADDIRAAIETGWFEAVQLHGDESPEFCAAVRDLGLPVIRGLALRTAENLELLATHPADAFILDAYAPGAFGGTGKLSDWALAAEAVRRFPDKVLWLSGGLTPENVAAALREVHPGGVDVASGVESSPAVKNPEKMRAFIAAAKGKPPIPD